MFQTLRIQVAQATSQLEQARALNEIQQTTIARQEQMFHHEKESWDGERRMLVDKLKSANAERDNAHEQSKLQHSTLTKEVQELQKQLRKQQFKLEELKEDNRRLESEAQRKHMESTSQIASLSAGKAEAEFLVDDLRRKVATLTSDALMAESTPVAPQNTSLDDAVREELALIRRELSRMSLIVLLTC